MKRLIFLNFKGQLKRLESKYFKNCFDYDLNLLIWRKYHSIFFRHNGSCVTKLQRKYIAKLKTQTCFSSLIIFKYTDDLFLL
jgi:hypothetical protein